MGSNIDLKTRKQEFDQMLSKLLEISHSYKQQLDEATEVINHDEDLSRKIDELHQKLQAEQKFYGSKTELLRKNEYDVNITNQRLNELQKELKEIVLREASIAISDGNCPLIFYIKKISDNTPLIERTRILSRLYETKTKNMQRLNELQKLRASVYCYDIDDDIPEYSLDDCIPAIEKSVYKKTIKWIEEKMPDSLVPSAADSIDKIYSNFSDINSTKQEQNELDVQILNFPTPYQCQYGAINPIPCGTSSDIKQMKSQIQDLDDEISFLSQQRQEAFTQICIFHTDDIEENEFLLTSDIIGKVHAKLSESQEQIDRLQQALHTNLSVPLETWNLQSQIHSQMNELVNLIKRIYARYSKDKKISSIKKPETKDMTIEVEELSHAQIERCRSILEVLQDVFFKSEEIHISMADQLEAQFEAFRKFLKKVEEDKDIKIVEPEPVEDETVNQFIEIRNQILDKQNSELRELSNLMNQLSPEIKSQIQIDTAEMPVVSEKFENDPPKELSFSSPQIPTDPTIEANQMLLDQIDQKPFIIQTPEIGKKRKEQKTTPNTQMNEVIDPWVKHITNCVSDDQAATLLSKKHSLQHQLEESKEKLRQIRERKIENEKKKEQMAVELETNYKENATLKEKTAYLSDKVKKVRAKVDSHELQNQIQDLEEKCNNLKMSLRNEIANSNRLSNIQREIDQVNDELNNFSANCDAEMEVLRQKYLS